nr:hypothetical protein CFP56_17660 [Quercus suber]
MKPGSKGVSKPHTYSHGINSSNSKLKKPGSCFDFTKLSEALNVAQAQEKGTVLDNINSSFSFSDAINKAANKKGTTTIASASSTYDLSSLSETLHDIQEEKKKERFRAGSMRYKAYFQRLLRGMYTKSEITPRGAEQRKLLFAVSLQSEKCLRRCNSQ